MVTTSAPFFISRLKRWIWFANVTGKDFCYLNQQSFRAEKSWNWHVGKRKVLGLKLPQSLP